MPYLAPGLVDAGLSRDGEITERNSASPVVRTLLAGAFAAPESGLHPAIAAMFADQASGLRYHVVPETSGAVATLGGNGADLVLLDLAGPISTVLDLVDRLRAAAAESVFFIGVMPADASQAARLYLPAVVDAVVHGPLLGAGLVWAVTDALQSTPVLSACPPLPLPEARTRH